MIENPLKDIIFSSIEQLFYRVTKKREQYLYLIPKLNILYLDM